MNNDNKNKPNLDPAEQGTTTVTTTVEESELESQESTVQLTPEEEKVVRMIHGKSLQGHEALEYAIGASEETQLRLALIEANLLDAFEAVALDPDPQSGVPRSVIADKMEH